MYKYGDRIIVDGKSAIFEEYSAADSNKAFVIIDPDTNAEGSMLVDVENIKHIRNELE